MNQSISQHLHNQLHYQSPQLIPKRESEEICLVVMSMDAKNPWDYNLFRTQRQLLCFQEEYIVRQKEHSHLEGGEEEEDEERQVMSKPA